MNCRRCTYLGAYFQLNYPSASGSYFLGELSKELISFKGAVYQFNHLVELVESLR